MVAKLQFSQQKSPLNNLFSHLKLLALYHQKYYLTAVLLFQDVHFIKKRHLLTILPYILSNNICQFHLENSNKLEFNSGFNTQWSDNKILGSFTKEFEKIKRSDL